MKSPRVPYKNFSRYVSRVPLFPVNFFLDLTKEDTISDNKLKAICEDQRVREALFLASPDLYSEFNKWIAGELNDEKSERIKFTLLKYLSRMSSRCTPFGLFAGTSVGQFSEKTDIELKENYKHSRHTRFDMNYLVALAQSIAKIDIVKTQLRFYPNTSIYKLGQQLRYIEYSYENANRVHHIVGVKDSWYLSEILGTAKSGATMKELANTITEDVAYEDAFDFVNELIDSQILISELEPSVSGIDFLDHIIQVLNQLEGTAPITSLLEGMKERLSKIDQSITNDISEYIDISKHLEPLDTKFQLKYLFQTDLMVKHQSNTISHEVLKDIYGALSVLNKLTSSLNNGNFSKFKAAFFERYETEPVRLSKALDKELGLGFIQDHNYGDVNMFVDDLELPEATQEETSSSFTTTKSHDLLLKKLIDSMSNGKDIIHLTDNDLTDFKEDWTDLPDTLSSMIEIITENGEEKIHVPFVAGSSAANLIGRFCHGNRDIKDLAIEITDTEKKIHGDKIVAEIVHLPESRVGNILFRPHLRDYEIPYLAQSTLASSKQVNINDLHLVAQSPEHLSIISKTHKKEVVPRLSNAHNFTIGSLPVYHFLASAQNSGTRNGIALEWGVLADKFDFLPRVEYKNIILSFKLWNIKKEDISTLVNTLNDSSKFKVALEAFVKSKKLPQFVMLKDQDNELLINLKNTLSARMLIDTVKKREGFQLKEFLHTTKSIVKQGEDFYANQIILSFYNEDRLQQSKN